MEKETGNVAEAAPSIGTELMQPNKVWIERYGDSEKSILYFNVAALRVVLNQHAKLINDMKAILTPAIEAKDAPTEPVGKAGSPPSG